jgi:hypothetical protein
VNFVQSQIRIGGMLRWILSMVLTDESSRGVEKEVIGVGDSSEATKAGRQKMNYAKFSGRKSLVAVAALSDANPFNWCWVERLCSSPSMQAFAALVRDRSSILVNHHGKYERKKACREFAGCMQLKNFAVLADQIRVGRACNCMWLPSHHLSILRGISEVFYWM